MNRNKENSKSLFDASTPTYRYDELLIPEFCVYTREQTNKLVVLCGFYL